MINELKNAEKIRVCDRNNLKLKLNEINNTNEPKEREIYYVRLDKSGLIFIKGYKESSGYLKEILLDGYLNPKEIDDLEVLSKLYYKVSHTFEYGAVVETKPQQILIKNTPQQIVSQLVGQIGGPKKEEDNEVISKDGSVCIKCKGTEELEFILHIDKIIEQTKQKEYKLFKKASK